MTVVNADCSLAVPVVRGSNTLVTDQEAAGGRHVEALAELRESAQAPSARAALGLHGDQPPAAHQDEIHLPALVPPVYGGGFPALPS